MPCSPGEQRGSQRGTPQNQTNSGYVSSCHLSWGDECGVSVLLLMRNEKQCAFRKKNGIKKKKTSSVCFLMIWLNYSVESVTTLENFRLARKL